MSRTKETPEFKAAFGAVSETGQSKPAPDEIDEIISYFEEKMQFDPPKGRYGIGADMPDTELYIGDKAAARGFICDKMRQVLRRLLFDVENKKER